MIHPSFDTDKARRRHTARIPHWMILSLVFCGVLSGCVFSPRKNDLDSGNGNGNGNGNGAALGFSHQCSGFSYGASQLGPSDIIEVRVFRHEDLSGPFRVAADGTIMFPLIGQITIGGKTANEVALLIGANLESEGYLRGPHVTVTVQEFNSKKVYVLGEVQKPSTFPYEDGMAVIQAITLAGGFTETAAPNSTTITRIVEGEEQKITVPVEEIAMGKRSNFCLAPGDHIFVPRSFF